MRVDKIPLIVIVVCAVAVLATPFHRSLVVRQFEQIVPGREKGIWGCIDPTIPSPRPKTDAQLLREHPKDFMLRLALAQGTFKFAMSAKSKNAKRAERAIRALQIDYPRQGVTYVLATELPEYADVDIPRRFEGSGITPEEAAQCWQKPEKPTKNQTDGVRRCITLMDKAVAADPGNGWFHYVKALYLYGLHRDTDALREIHLSAIAPRFTDYTNLRARSLDHLLDLRGGFNPERRAAKKAFIAFPFLARMREAARITAHLAYRDIRRGNLDRGVCISQDLTNASYNMAKNAPTFIHGLVGKALQAIGAAALDPTFKSKADDFKAQSRARLDHYKHFLVAHRYSREAAVLETQWQQSDRMLDRTRAFTERECIDSMVALYRFPVVFATATGILAILTIFGAAWFVAFVFTAKSDVSAFWDRRAAVTSGLLSALVLAPLITDIVTAPASADWITAMFFDSADESPLRPVFLLIPFGVMVTALLAGLIVMLKRTPKEGENRSMPPTALVVAYLAAVGGLAYLAYGLVDFAEWSSGFRSLQNVSSALMILGPIAAVALYGLLRAAQFRFGRVRKNAVACFVATVRYSSAIAVGLFAGVYVCALILTFHSAVEADQAARAIIVREAAIVQSAFR